jgi:hypothetical protein
VNKEKQDMSLDSEMKVVAHSLATAASVRRQALDRIRAETADHLVETRAERNRMAETQRMLRSEALRSTHLATAMVLGKANEMIDEYRRERIAQAEDLKRALSDGAKQLRVRTHKWLGTEAALRMRLAGAGRRERLDYRATLRKTMATTSKRHQEFLGSLTNDRYLAAGAWRSQSTDAPALMSVAPPDSQDRSARYDAETQATEKREAEAKAVAKREAEVKAVAKKEVEAVAKKEAEAKRASAAAATKTPSTPSS